MDFETAALVLSWVAIALLGLAMAGLVRQVQWLTAGGRSLQHVGPTIGSYALPLVGVDYASARETVVVFLTADCPLCGRIAPEATALASRTSGDDVRVVVAHVGSDHSGGPGTVPVSEQELKRWRVSVTPFAVRVGSDSRVVEAAPIESTTSLRRLVAPSENPKEVAA